MNKISILYHYTNSFGRFISKVAQNSVHRWINVIETSTALELHPFIFTIQVGHEKKISLNKPNLTTG